jgi:septal ring factor EnvC (AmiA/AmiB activator)
MRLVVQAALLALWLAAAASGQEVRKAADWEKMYQDASAQLRAAQDRKSELSAENTRLSAKIAQLQQNLQAAQAEADSLAKQLQALDTQSAILRAFHAGWYAFLRIDPVVSFKWQRFWGNTLPSWADNQPLVVDLNWPLPPQ